MNDNAVISFDEVSFSYDNTIILDSFNFHIKRGEHIAIKGESGTGKTTLFRLLLGFEQPDGGKILFQGNPLDTTAIKQLRKETAWLPQDLNLGSGPTQEVLSFPFQFSANAGTAPDPKGIREVFVKLGLNPSLLENKFPELSTGQRQRVGIALCHLLNKPLILLDEPTSALDHASKQKVIDLLFDNSERTILSTSHDSYWIERCDKVIELD